MKTIFYKIFMLALICHCSSFLLAQKTVEFRINGIASNIGDMDGFGAGASDPQWNYEVVDNTFGVSDNNSIELSGTNCPGIRSHLRTFFSQQYDCQLPNSFNFVFRGFEDDGIGSDANSGDRTFTFNTSTLITTGSTTWRNVFGGSGWVEVRASGTTCSAGMNTPVSTQGSGSVRYQIRLQYRVLGASLCHDECNDPYIIPTAAEYECGSTQTSTSLNMNVSALEPADASQFSHTMAGITCTYDGASAEDIWVRTTIPDSSGGVIIQFENNGGCNATFCQTNITYAWYTSSNGTCSGLEYRGCDAVSCFIGCSDGEIKVDGRAGEDVWVRIWEEDDQGFEITINQITPTAPADKCYTAMPLGPTGCNYQATAPSSGTYAEPDLASWTAGAHPGGVCQDGDSDPSTNTVWSSNENMVWYTFSHGGGPFNVAVDNMTCSGGAATAQLGVFSNSGTAQNPSCNLGAETGYGCSVGVGQVQLSIGSLPAGDYILVVDGNAGAQCEWEFYETIGGPLLPLELIAFRGAYNESTKAVDLSWTAKNEDQVAGYFIERSVDGLSFDPVDFVPAEGEPGVDLIQYSYNDAGYPDANVLYYRLEMTDYNGVTRYSNTVAVSPKRGERGASVLYDPYPNPTSNALFIPFETLQEDYVTAQFYDMAGRLVKTVVNNELQTAGYHVLEVNTDDLANGVYVLRFTAGNITEMKRVVKQ